jgi:MinD-like ATPase involved in chromosome partitioning or flagellar assembly
MAAPNPDSSKKPTEIIAICSGKGGTGKTVIAACLGYALASTGHSTLYIDTDTATDGLSLFLLGPEGASQQDHISSENTFETIIGDAPKDGEVPFSTFPINRSQSSDHGVVHEAIISGKALYGDLADSEDDELQFRISRSAFRSVVQRLFEQLRESGEYDYVIVDTRGGFSFETTEVCSLADSFIVVTEPQYTSFYQDRNLVGRISVASERNETRPLLRGFIVNKSTDPRDWSGELELDRVESDFRVTLTREFPVRFQETHPVPLDIDAQIAYKSQKIPLRDAPDSYFSFALLTAFRQLLTVVTAEWSDEQAEKWNELVDQISDATKERNRIEQEAQSSVEAQVREQIELREQVSDLEREVSSKSRELDDTRARFEREISRSDSLLQQTTGSKELILDQSIDEISVASSKRLGWLSNWQLGLMMIAVGALLGTFYLLVVVPDSKATFVSCTTDPTTVEPKSAAILTVNVLDNADEPVRGVEISVTTSAGQVVNDAGESIGTTDAGGNVHFTWLTPDEVSSRLAIEQVVFSVVGSGGGYDSGAGSCSAFLNGPA